MELVIADLHGNVAAAVSPGSDPEYLAGFRYDAFGQSVDAYAGGGAPSIPYRFQGRILQSAEASTDLMGRLRGAVSGNLAA
jgi:hypothetical protein